ncbi:phosphoethanolamine N-methyltransferase [Pholiota molesta]|nr:phosphoethanolamine N-methyltransferase [Pholiota molesta]
MGSSRLSLLVWVFLVHLVGIYLFTRGFLLTRLSLPNSPPARIQAVANSFIFNAYSDPPTTTLQRIKGITTGSLPTFIDIGNNFGGSSIAEDSLLKQLKMAGKKLAFMGDDTWMSVFPDTFERNMTHPYDSFNVEDLHTVDEGVITHLFPLLEDASKHSTSSSATFRHHPSMKAKLQQMDDVLRRVVDKMDKDTLLVVLGDHGMDRSGDHGGDGVLETSSAMWIYSKGPALTEMKPSVPDGILQYKTFPGAEIRHRAIQQIDILPTVSLLLGLPIPFNNLGTVIPELFWRDSTGRMLEKGLEINAAQIMAYLDTYRASPSGGELDEAWKGVRAAWAATLASGLTGDAKLVTLTNFNRVALAACRAMWAQFNPLLMGLGLSLLSFLAGSMALIISTPPNITKESLKSTPVILILHSIAFLSNSFTFWEDRIVPFLLISSIIPYVLVGFTAPNRRLRYRILGFSLLFAVCVRLISISTVCREEQQPYCHVTFFASSSLPSPPQVALYFALPVAAGLPYVIKRYLKITRSDNGIAIYFLPLILAPSLCAGSLYWIMEWADSASVFGAEWAGALRLGRTLLARISFGLIILGGGTLWWSVPVCLNIEVTQQGEKRQVQVLGFANAFGAPYFIFWTISLCLVYISSQITGQLVLALAVMALLSFLEVLDSVRDVKGIEAAFATAAPSAVLDPAAASDLSPPIRFVDIIPIALLGLHVFYGTGHQSTISSIQWKSAFMLTPAVSYPFSVVTVFLNSIGPIFLLALAAPLVALWNRAPQPANKAGADEQVKRESTLAGLGVMIYYSALLLGRRRHLMVWKVFAPRFMAAVLELWLWTWLFWSEWVSVWRG